MKHLLPLIACLSACASTGTMDDLAAGLRTLKGQPLAVAVAKLGYPSSSMRLDGDTIYTWDRSFLVSEPSYSTATTAGTVAGHPYSATTGTLASENVQYRCKVRIAVGPDNIVKGGNYDGNAGGCAPYIRALTP